MKRLTFLFLFLAAGLLSFRTDKEATWTIDPMHSQLRFSISLLGLSDIEGSFKITQGSITANNQDFTDATVNITFDMNSVDTDVDDRDKHLRTADFFDAAKYPTSTFKSTSFRKTGEGRYTVAGDLTMHGVTKQVTLEVVGKEAVHPVTKKPVAGFKVNGIVKRSDFGISPATPASMLSDEVRITANVQFGKN